MSRGLVLLLACCAVLNLWGLSSSGWANAYYAAAAQSGAASWKGFFFVSSDLSHSVSVDKTSLSLWVMAASVRVFGLHSWSILVPQALMGVASVGVLFAAVRRSFPAGAALLAGTVLALTPVATLMFRFNNPDALLVLLLVSAAYAVLRAVESASTRWLVLAGALVGLAFLTKMGQALLVVPSFALAYLVAAPTSIRRRLLQAGAAAVALLVAAGWWLAAVELTPARHRPYVGGSTGNSVVELALGYNGLGRLSAERGGGSWGETGWARMLAAPSGAQIGWLLPVALLLCAAGLVVLRHAPRTDARRAAFLLWGGWLLGGGAVLSGMQGIYHPYYTVVLAPAVAALVGMGCALVWERRSGLGGRLLLCACVVGAGATSAGLLARTPDWLPWLGPVVLVGAAALSVVVVTAGPRLPAAAWTVVAASALVVSLAGSAAYSVRTASLPHGGAVPLAGPRPATPDGAAASGLPPEEGLGDELVGLLRADHDSMWVAAAIGSLDAAPLQLASGRPVLPVGGFNGGDPWPSLEQFQSHVAEGRIHYFVAGRGFGADTVSRPAQGIARWVREGFAAASVGGRTVYDLTRPRSGDGPVDPRLLASRP